MSEPKTTLKSVLELQRSRPTTPEFDLASIQFLELPQAEQMAALFRAAVELSAAVDFLMARK